MQIIENLLFDEELERIIDRIFVLERSSGFWDRRVFRKARINYEKLRTRINNLNLRISNFNFDGQNPGYDSEEDIYCEILEEKRMIFEESRDICVGLRGDVVDRKMEKRYGASFVRKVQRYEESVFMFHEYLGQEASRRDMPLSGMVRVERLRNERGY